MTLDAIKYCYFGLIIVVIATLIVVYYGVDVQFSQSLADTYIVGYNLMRLLPNAEVKKGYVMAMKNSGQQASGIRAIKSLQCWAGTLPVPMNILEPVFRKSSIVATLPTTTTSVKNSSQYIFSDIFDIDVFNEGARNNHLPQIATSRQFFDEAPKKVILVWMRLVKRTMEQRPKVIWPHQERELSECLDQQISEMKLQKYVSKIPQSQYCIVKVVQVPFIAFSKKIFSQEEGIALIYGHWSPAEVTVVFTEWRALWRNTANEVCYMPSSEYFQPSNRIINQAQLYEKHYFSGRNTLAIMFRLERMVGYLQQSDEDMNVTNCLKKVVDIVQETQAEQATIIKPFITMDMGVSGSSTWHVTLNNHHRVNMTFWKMKAEEAISTISNGEWSTVKDWEESFKHRTESTENSAYTAALQRTIASRADCLILVGGGHFQSIALKDYIENHPKEKNQCVKFVCALEDITIN